MAAAPPQRRLNSRRLNLLALVVASAFGQLMNTARAQNNAANATVDPGEGRALNTIFVRWDISATDQWNISGELCSGVAIDGTDISNGDISPKITCDCSSTNDSLCHITGLRVDALDVFGPLPDELWNLTYLTYLNLGKNYLTGPIPASIGNLRNMQDLSLYMNALSGELPEELGLLIELRHLSLSTNNFSGPLPSELGNLKKLQYIYFDSCGVSGPIPPSFAGLRNLEIVWGSDNDLTGPIPDFIGSWSSLLELRFQGNSFEGPIPQSFSSLTSLNDLRISELSNGGSSLDFLRNMTSLSTLVLRNNNISGSIPSLFVQLQSLRFLDLSFNNLTGQIPAELFNSSYLTNLFLGNNRLTGGIPDKMSSTLTNVDLSYNELSGSFPTWLGYPPYIQINLVANNFTNLSFSSYPEAYNTLPSGLICLQRNFPCNRGSPIYSTFAIKCGGPQIMTSNGTVYEMENEALGPATHFMTGTRRWAVSNVGLPVDSTNEQYQTTSSSQFTNTSDTEFYQTARVSAGSLRYYGLGLEKGLYTVRLHFAEMTIEGSRNSRSWRSLGRRVFDVYIQGNLVLKNFDIRREEFEASLTPVVREFIVQVSENYLEVHLFWAGKGTCCVPVQFTYGPSISAIRATPNFRPTVSNNPPGGSDNRTGLVVGIIIGVAVVALVTLGALFYVLRRRKRQSDLEDEELLGIDIRPYTFGYAELKSATNDFNPGNKLGEGGFGPVYKGTLGDGRIIAVKQLSVASRQGKSQFIAEIATVSAVQHRNLVKLYGCCIEGDKRLLVYEYLENKSLDRLLFGAGSSSLHLDWPTRFNICLGVARGLAYLHEESRLRIVHRDVKASNILLDSDLTPKISDFGLAKLYDDKKTHISTRVAGTIGYLSPEYAMRGHLTEKADIFSFGVVAMEIVSGRPNSDTTLEDDMIYLLEWAWNLHENGRELELVDPTLQQYNVDEVKRIIGVALLCTQASPALRPTMSHVVAMLSEDIEVPSVTTRPSYLTGWTLNDATTFMRNADSSTSNADISSTDSRMATTKRSDSYYSPSVYSLENPAKPMLHEIIG